MTETNWGESEAPVRKKSIPTWLWFCGGGCLLALVLAIAGGAWGVSLFKDAMDPEKQWPNVQAILPYDEQPPELQLVWGSTFPMDVFVFLDQRGYGAMLFRFAESDAHEVREQLLNPEFKGGFMGAGARKDLQAASVDVQGRELPVLRFYQSGGGEPSGPGAPPNAGSGASIVVDLSDPGDVRPLVLQLVRHDGDEPISDDEVRQFLEPFHVGPDR